MKLSHFIQFNIIVKLAPAVKIFIYTFQIYVSLNKDGIFSHQNFLMGKLYSTHF